MEAKVAKDGQSQILPLLPGPNGAAIVKLGEETIAPLVQNQSLPSDRLLVEDIVSPAGSSTYPLGEDMEIMELWAEDQLQDLPPQGSDPYALAEHHPAKEELGQDQGDENMEDENMPEDQCMAELQDNTNHEGDEDIADQQGEQLDKAEPERDAETADRQGDEDRADEEADEDADSIFQTTPNQRTKASMVDSNHQVKENGKKVQNKIIMKKPSGVLLNRPSGLLQQKSSGLLQKKPSGLVKKKPSASKSEAFEKVTEGEFKGRCHKLMWYKSGGFLAIRQTTPPKKQLASMQVQEEPNRSLQDWHGLDSPIGER